MKRPTKSDFTVKRTTTSVTVYFKPSASEYTFQRMSNGSLDEPTVSHQKTGDSGGYNEQEVLAMAQELASAA
jgi:hypothetical protein